MKNFINITMLSILFCNVTIQTSEKEFCEASYKESRAKLHSGLSAATSLSSLISQRKKIDALCSSKDLKELAKIITEFDDKIATATRSRYALKYPDLILTFDAELTLALQSAQVAAQLLGLENKSAQVAAQLLGLENKIATATRSRNALKHSAQILIFDTELTLALQSAQVAAQLLTQENTKE